MADEAGLDDADKELLENNRHERSHIETEIQELRERNHRNGVIAGAWLMAQDTRGPEPLPSVTTKERRKKEREEEEKRMAEQRAAEDARRKAEEEERRRKKEEDDMTRRADRARKMAEFEKWKNPPKANFVISKRLAGEEGAEAGEEEGKAKKSKEQLEAEKNAILRQRIKPLEIDGMGESQLAEKARELHTQILRLEGEKYDLEKRFKQLQVEMMDLAERARQANKVGKEGGIKRIGGTEESVDRIQERFAGAPSKVEMFSKYERQKDKRTYGDRKVLYTGPQWSGPAERIKPSKIVSWNEEGLPTYEEQPMGGYGEPAPAAYAAEVVVAE